LGGSGPYNITAHAIVTNTVTYINNVTVTSFGGNGLHITACANEPSGDNSNYGNASLSVIRNFSAFYCTNGIFSEGCDANSILYDNCNTSQNRRWGQFNNGFLGDKILKPHCAFNGVPAINGGNSVVKYGGLYYTARPGFDGYFLDAADSNYNKQPDVNPTYWLEVTAMTFNDWNDSTRYYSGGPICIRGENAWTNIDNPYIEGFQPPIYLNSRGSVTNGGDVAADVVNGIYENVIYGEKHYQNGGVLMQKYLHVGTLSFDAASPMKVYNDYSKTATLIGVNTEGTSSAIYNQFKSNSATALHGIVGSDYFVYIGGQMITKASTAGLRPDADNTFDLGTSTTNRWKNIYAALGAGAPLNAQCGFNILSPKNPLLNCPHLLF